MRSYILPYKLGSASASLLARALNILRVDGSKTFKRGTTIINWGNSAATIRSRFPVKVLNNPSAVVNARNKIKAFNLFKQKGTPHPEYTTSMSVAETWLQQGDIVYCRTNVDTYGGKGIVVVNPGEQLVAAPLYTKKFNSINEYRVHIVTNEVIDFSLKKKRRDVEVNTLIRNSDNGWVFCREGVSLPTPVKVAAISAVHNLNLDFGAVDVMYNPTTGQARVLEVNTAPGIEGTTLNKYVEKFRSLL